MSYRDEKKVRRYSGILVLIGLGIWILMALDLKYGFFGLMTYH